MVHLQPIGEQMLNNRMKNIAKMTNLMQNYMNHCVRATTVNILAHAGISDRKIMKITGHKCEASLTSYHADSSNQQKIKYSTLLQGLQERPTPNAAVREPVIVPSPGGMVGQTVGPNTSIDVQRSSSTVSTATTSSSNSGLSNILPWPCPLNIHSIS